MKREKFNKNEEDNLKYQEEKKKNKEKFKRKDKKEKINSTKDIITDERFKEIHSDEDFCLDEYHSAYKK